MPTGMKGRVFAERITLRFSGPEKAELDEAVRLSPVAWKGMSLHLRAACLDWARAAIASSTAKDARHRAHPRKPAPAAPAAAGIGTRSDRKAGTAHGALVTRKGKLHPEAAALKKAAS